MKKILFLFLFPFVLSAQFAPNFIELKPAFTKVVQFNFTGAIQQWTVPAGVTQIFVDAFGAQGGTSVGAGVGGLGGRIRGSISVIPGDVLQIVVGGRPTSRLAVYGFGGNGGTNPANASNISLAGGGLSGVFISTTISRDNALFIAAGGGGAAKERAGGNGGGSTGLVTVQDNTRGGKGGTQLAGGAAGTQLDANSVAPTAGSSSAGLPNVSGGVGGGVGTSTWNSGGGGGAGYFGGGGGAGGGNYFGGGGGGSSWAIATALKVNNLASANAGNGKLLIYFN